jgi:hypothetical protein
MVGEDWGASQPSPIVRGEETIHELIREGIFSFNGG